ncbi:response regulator [Aurantiacibacter aquimixticola]|uniref:Response regulator n=1 Tax=Aurantiacibacter aquimixticola TaxID=1958945 RepID=A0A419RTY9_9SPHN|nr:response regulator [Aurantiacibacter aquimixticola]RJY09214.1 response regulator [Aurantiacibacter aquimixticola]
MKVRAAMPNVMIVDDEAMVLLDLVMTVEELGYEVHSECCCLKNALDAADGAPPDVALLDIDVAGEPVWPLARKLAEKGRPMVFISANLSHAELREEFAECLALDKPVSRAEIAEAIEQALAPQGA